MILKAEDKVIKVNSGKEVEGTIVGVMPMGKDKAILASAFVRELGSKIPPDHVLEAIYLVKWHDSSWFPSIEADYYVKSKENENTTGQ